jgi:hypothetical protein
MHRRTVADSILEYFLATSLIAARADHSTLIGTFGLLLGVNCFRGWRRLRKVRIEKSATLPSVQPGTPHAV